MATLLRSIAQHPVVAFMGISLAAGFLTAAIRPISDAEVLPYGLPLHGLVGGLLGVGLGAFLVTGALKSREGVMDLARRSVRWRVHVRWYLVAIFTVPLGAILISLAIYGPRAVTSLTGGWPRALAGLPPSSCSNYCSSSSLKRSDSPAFSSTTGRIAITPEAHFVRRAFVGAVAHTGPLRRRRMGSRGADFGAGDLRHRVRFAVLRACLVCVVLQRDSEQCVAGGNLSCQLRRSNQPARR